MKRRAVIITFILASLFLAACQGGSDDTVDATPNPDSTEEVETPRDSANSTNDEDGTPVPTVTQVPYTQVVVAIQNIPRGVVIEPDRVATVRYPVESVPRGALAEIEDVVGLIAATDIFSEEIILARKLVAGFDSLGSVGSDAAALLDPSRVAVAIPMDRQTSVAYALQPGDRVDVIVSMLFVDIDQDFQTILPNRMTSGFYIFATDAEGGITRNLEMPDTDYLADEFDSRTLLGSDAGTISTTGEQTITTTVRDDLIIPVVIQPSEQQRPRLVTQRTVTDAQVVWVGDFPQDGRVFRLAPTPTPVATQDPDEVVQEGEGENVPPTAIPDNRPTIITLAVRPQDAVTLAYMAEAGIPMTFALRSARTQGLPDTSPVTLQYILDTYNIAVPESLSYGIEPAIRSIRGITLPNIFASSTGAPDTSASDNTQNNGNTTTQDGGGADTTTETGN